ncbi:hypothetical protein ACFYZ9_17665 [Streptomyces sp. NPDC001691]|uniref:hypothetical protein n=1 Tax=unclassified Streptomyces TaxID=2593676 RepID=UPI000DEBE30F|nr:hypothetical protein [Streptomyces sp. SDr-06]RCH67905.1 hypothetical protein DT019_16535 [Streptomyces sp. SDr-06]
MRRCPSLATTAIATCLIAAALTSCSGGKGASDTKHPKTPAASQSAGATSAPPAPGAPGALAYGPGPQAKYTVAAQPSPGTCHYRYTADKQPLPDPKCTPGALNPKVTQENLASTVCKSGYTGTIRPPVSVTGPEKTANARSYDYTGALGDGEYDHLVSLVLGGDPDDPRNLWVEPPSPDHKPGGGPNNPKDTVESKLSKAVCSGKVQLKAAQSAIATDWTTALAKLGIS